MINFLPIKRRVRKHNLKFWLDEYCPDELRRRADEAAADGLLAVAEQFRARARELEDEK